MLYQTLNIYGVRAVRYTPSPDGKTLAHLDLDLVNSSLTPHATALIRFELAADAADDLVAALTAAFTEPGVELRPAERIAREEADVLDSVDTAGLVNR